MEIRIAYSIGKGSSLDLQTKQIKAFLCVFIANSQFQIQNAGLVMSCNKRKRESNYSHMYFKIICKLLYCKCDLYAKILV